MQGESADILYAIDERYPDGPALLPADPAMRAAAKELIGSFRAVMPSGLRPSARTAFLFQGAGQAAGRPVFESTLDGVEEVRFESCIEAYRAVGSTGLVAPPEGRHQLPQGSSTYLLG